MDGGDRPPAPSSGKADGAGPSEAAALPEPTPVLDLFSADAGPAVVLLIFALVAAFTSERVAVVGRRGGARRGRARASPAHAPRAPLLRPFCASVHVLISDASLESPLARGRGAAAARPPVDCPPISHALFPAPRAHHTLSICNPGTVSKEGGRVGRVGATLTLAAPPSLGTLTTMIRALARLL